jgi:hypothetical protein
MSFNVVDVGAVILVSTLPSPFVSPYTYQRSYQYVNVSSRDRQVVKITLV